MNTNVLLSKNTSYINETFSHINSCSINLELLLNFSEIRIYAAKR